MREMDLEDSWWGLINPLFSKCNSMKTNWSLCSSPWVTITSSSCVRLCLFAFLSPCELGVMRAPEGAVEKVQGAFRGREKLRRKPPALVSSQRNLQNLWTTMIQPTIAPQQDISTSTDSHEIRQRTFILPRGQFLVFLIPLTLHLFTKDVLI